VTAVAEVLLSVILNKKRALATRYPTQEFFEASHTLTDGDQGMGRRRGHPVRCKDAH
jgi:hypothetical protein